MRKIKNYNDFCNEEINWRKAATSVALGASLLGGVSCKKSDIKPETQKIEQSQETTWSDGTNLNDKLDVIVSKDSISIKNISNKKIQCYNNGGQVEVSFTKDSLGTIPPDNIPGGGYKFVFDVFEIGANQQVTLIDEARLLSLLDSKDIWLVIKFNSTNTTNGYEFTFSKKVSDIVF